MKKISLILFAAFISMSFKADMLSDCSAGGQTYYSIDDALKDVSNAKRLDIAMNKFKTIDPKIGKLVNLECLDLSFNLFSTLPKEMANLNKVSYLNLAGTQYMASLPDVIYKMKGLKTIDLQDHPLWSKKTKDEINKKLAHVKIIWAADNTKPATLPSGN